MVDELIDRYLQDVHRHVQITGPYRKRILQELRDHLEQATADLESNGLAAQDATEQAIATLGPASEVARRFPPMATRRTRLLAVLAGIGASVGLGAIPVAGSLHASGERLGADLRYSLVWALGVGAAAAAVGLLLAIALRLGGRQPAVKAAAAIAAVGLAAMGAFHLANDGSLDRGPGPDAWRLAALGAGVATSSLLLFAFRQTTTPFAGAARMTLSALLLLAFHYTVLDQRGPIALIGVTALALAWLWALAILVRERPLA